MHEFSWWILWIMLQWVHFLTVTWPHMALTSREKDICCIILVALNHFFATYYCMTHSTSPWMAPNVVKGTKHFFRHILLYDLFYINLNDTKCVPYHIYCSLAPKCMLLSHIIVILLTVTWNIMLQYIICSGDKWITFFLPQHCSTHNNFWSNTSFLIKSWI